MEKKGAMVGSKVSIKLDKHDVTGVQGVHGFVFEVREGGGVQVMTLYGIVTQKNGKKWFIPKDQYVVMDDDTHIGATLQIIGP
jgi:hypothetical protein